MPDDIEAFRQAFAALHPTSPYLTHVRTADKISKVESTFGGFHYELYNSDANWTFCLSEHVVDGYRIRNYEEYFDADQNS